MQFAENLQFLRKRAELTQEQLAEQLSVTRQSVSKWESGGGFPEMEKLLQICALFQCDLDTLLRGSVEQSSREDIYQYDPQYNSMVRAIVIGVVLCILGGALCVLMEGLGLHERWSALSLMVLVIAAVTLFIVAGLRWAQFEERHPYVPPFYTEEEREAFVRRYPVYIAGGVALCILFGLFCMMMDGVQLPDWVSVNGLPMTVERSEEIMVGSGMVLVAAGVGLLIYGGMQNGKYDLQEYNRVHSEEYQKAHAAARKVCGVIMLVATAIFLLYLFLVAGVKENWKQAGMVAGAVYSVGGVASAVAWRLLGKEEE